MTTNYQSRKEKLQRLAKELTKEPFKDEFVTAYIEETSFVYKSVIGREIDVPGKLLLQNRLEEHDLINRYPLGKVAVLIPKNSVGLTLAKAIASSYLMGNHTIVYFPKSIKKTAAIYSKLLTNNLENIEVVNGDISSAAFMRECLKDPFIKAIVIYGDDSWIDAYRSLAESTKTKIIFEGPGNDPMVVFPDADVEAAAFGAIEGGLNNGGQSCSAIERFFIHESLLEAFKLELINRLKSLKVGSPNNEKTDIGPIASKIIFSRMNRQIKESIEMGAKLEFGGDILFDENTNLPILTPAVLTNCLIDMPIVKNETFGPVFPLVSFSTTNELLHLLDETKYGLNACCYGTAPSETVEYLERSHRNVYYNSNAASSCNLPSRLMDGGFKRSGLIWDFSANETVRTGRRMLTLELSKTTK